MHVVKGMVPEVGGYAGAGNEAGYTVKTWVGHKVPEMAVAWNAVIEKPVGAVVPMKALLAAMAVKGAKAVAAVLAVGAAEMAMA